MYKYQIWCENDMFYDSEKHRGMTYKTYEEAEEKAEKDVKYYTEGADCDATDDYWYKIKEV